MSNIVEAQNKVLSKVFGTECYMHSFKGETPVDPWDLYQGLWSSYIEFYSSEEIPEVLWQQSTKGCKIVGCEKIRSHCGGSDNYKYYGILLYGSKLRKKLLKAMLKYN